MEREEEANEAGEVFGTDGGDGAVESVGRLDQTTLSKGQTWPSTDGDREDAAGVFFAAVVWVGG